MPTRATVKVGLIGYGVIGRAIAQNLRGQPEAASIVCVLSRTGAHSTEAASVTTIEALLQHHPDVVIECASQDALRAHGESVLEAGYPLVAASIGAFADEDLYRHLIETAQKNSGQLLLPSGGLAGTDALAAAKSVGLQAVTYRGSAPPESWGLRQDAASRMLFEGSARDACREFPKNANVAAAVSLAGIGFERTTVQLIADPKLWKYRHEILASGAFGELSTLVNAEPIAAGQRSTRLIVGSLVATALSAR